MSRLPLPPSTTSFGSTSSSPVAAEPTYGVSQPTSLARPYVRLQFSVTASMDWGRFFEKFEFKATLNGGYAVRATLFDPSFNMLDRLITATGGFLATVRSEIITLIFQIRAGDNGTFPDSATRPQIAYLIGMRAVGDAGDYARVEFIAIDPATWYLTRGRGAGSQYRGKVSKVIRTVVSEYAPEIDLEISETVDSEANQWWMSRLDPISFIASFLDWSSAVTKQRTNWLVGMDGNVGGRPRLVIKEQAELMSIQRAYYRFWADAPNNTILSWEMLSNCALATVHDGIVTQGISAVSGVFLDRLTGAVVSDANTGSKLIPQTTSEQAFSKSRGTQTTGRTSVPAVPEIYSAGDLGLYYGDYIDGHARKVWLELTHNLLKVRFRCLGHGIWSDSLGLGSDTIFVRWTKAVPSESGSNLWFATGKWLVYGFKHIVTRGEWRTDVFASRFDYDAVARRV